MSVSINTLARGLYAQEPLRRALILIWIEMALNTLTNIYNNQSCSLHRIKIPPPQKIKNSYFYLILRADVSDCGRNSFFFWGFSGKEAGEEDRRMWCVYAPGGQSKAQLKGCCWRGESSLLLLWLLTPLLSLSPPNARMYMYVVVLLSIQEFTRKNRINSWEFVDCGKR